MPDIDPSKCNPPSFRKRVLVGVLAVVFAIAAIGTVFWIIAVARPVAQIAPAAVRSTRYFGGTLSVESEPSGAETFDRLGMLVQSYGLALANGETVARGRIGTIAFTLPRSGLRLVFDPGILAAGAASAQTPDHLLGLAGAGSVWPAPAQAAAYCGRMDTQRGDFCRHVTGR